MIAFNRLKFVDSQQKKFIEKNSLVGGLAHLDSDFWGIDKQMTHNYVQETKNKELFCRFIFNLSHVRFREKGLEGNLLRTEYRNKLFAWVFK